MIKRRYFLPLLAVAFAAGCNDSTGPAEGGQLTASEAMAIAVAVDNSSSTAVQPEAASGVSMSLIPTTPAPAIGTHNASIDVTLECPRGGTANLQGEQALVIDTDEGFITLDVTATQNHTDCGFRTGEGVDVVIDGAVSLAAARELREGLISASQSHAGSLAYSTSDGKAGTCAIDISTSFVLEPGSISRIIAGNVCGHTVDVTTTWAE